MIRASILVKLSPSPGSNPTARNLIQLQQMSFPCSDCPMGIFSRVPELFSIYWNILEIFVHVEKGRYSLRYEILDISNDAPSYSIRLLEHMTIFPWNTLVCYFVQKTGLLRTQQTTHFLKAEYSHHPLINQPII